MNPDDVNENGRSQLGRRPAVHGKISSDAGGPVANVVVTAEIPQYAGASFLPAFDLGQAAQPTVVTNESGQYRFEIPYGCEIKLRAEHPDFVTERTEVAVKEGEPEVELDLTISRPTPSPGRC